ncbi:MAG: glycosyltransferase family 2 protein [Bacteroidales bacterium]|nr:glycosyltransferase family 2 protein [Bacteroidales bacterium]MDZ4203680.1 glycosyltransferase family 2 protein [Bacteroidales bacterium]
MRSTMVPGIRISVVVPCYNEEGNISELYHKLNEVLGSFNQAEIIFVDDGSTDCTSALVEKFAHEDKRVQLISLSRNFGHQFALKAGLDHSIGDCVISLDADLQHPPSLIPDMIKKWNEGYDVVYTVRRDSRKLPFFKKLTSRCFYFLAKMLSSVDVHPGAADFRLLDRSVVDVLKECRESYLYIRGLVSWAGFRQTSIEYTPDKRFAGKTKYSTGKMIRFAMAGITSFSIRPLQLSLILGIIIAGIAFIYGLYVVCIYTFTSKAVAGWTSTTASVLFIGGIQLIILGILGEYIGKTYIENKRRPTYVIRKKHPHN